MPEALDDIFFSRIRLMVVAALLPAEWIAFAELQTLTSATRGNLGSHLGKLVDAGIIEEDKRFVDQRPLTRYRLTDEGRAAFLRHVAHVDRLFQAARREYGEAATSPDRTPITEPPLPTTS